jgi:hypothetical protein
VGYRKSADGGRAAAIIVALPSKYRAYAPQVSRSHDAKKISEVHSSCLNKWGQILFFASLLQDMQYNAGHYERARTRSSLDQSSPYGALQVGNLFLSGEGVSGSHARITPYGFKTNVEAV